MGECLVGLEKFSSVVADREVAPSMKLTMVRLMVECSAILIAYVRASQSSHLLKKRTVML